MTYLKIVLLAFFAICVGWVLIAKFTHTDPPIIIKLGDLIAMVLFLIYIIAKFVDELKG